MCIVTLSVEQQYWQTITIIRHTMFPSVDGNLGIVHRFHSPLKQREICIWPYCVSNQVHCNEVHFTQLRNRYYHCYYHLWVSPGAIMETAQGQAHLAQPYTFRHFSIHPCQSCSKKVWEPLDNNLLAVFCSNVRSVFQP